MEQSLLRFFKKASNTGSDILKKKDLIIISLTIILIISIVGFILSRQENNNTKLDNTKLVSVQKHADDILNNEENGNEKVLDDEVKEQETAIETVASSATPSPVLTTNVEATTDSVIQKVVIDEPITPIITPTQKVDIETPTPVNVKQIVSYEEQTESQELEVKYGVKKIKVLHYNVIKYDDGTSEKNFVYDEITYDKSGYNASTNDVLSEARSIASQNIGIYSEVTNYVNNYRNAAGVGTVELDNELSVAATVRALEMAYSGGVFDISHTRPNGSYCFSIFNEFNINNITSGGENIAAGQKDALAAATAWYNSPGHRENMEDSSFKKIGVGMYELDGIKYWVQLFIG